MTSYSFLNFLMFFAYLLKMYGKLSKWIKMLKKTRDALNNGLL